MLHHVAAVSEEVPVVNVCRNITAGETSIHLKSGYLATAMKRDSGADLPWADTVKNIHAT